MQEPAPSLPSHYRRFLELETVGNLHLAEVVSTVSPAYRPGAGPFAVPYVDIPLSDLHVVDSGLGDASLRAHGFVNVAGTPCFRFFVHPDSAALYEKVVRAYRGGTYWAWPTASTRTLLMIDPARPELPPFF